MSKVFANGRSMVHKGDGLVNTCPAPDVCKTPSPGGPVPIPYVNVARDGDLAKGSQSVSIEGNPIALKDSNLGTSSGDEAGTAGGGIISSKTKGKMTWASSSIDVKIEGKGVIRFLDVCLHNGNTSNSGGEPAQGAPQVGQPTPPEFCAVGTHVENEIIYPEPPETERDVQARIDAMTPNDKGSRFERLAALHNYDAKHLTSGNQITRARTPEEKAAGKKGDWQYVKIRCSVCKRVREIEHAYIENDRVVIVEAKDKKKLDARDRDKAIDNAVFAKTNNAIVCYKVPQFQDQRRRRVLEPIFDKAETGLSHLRIVSVAKTT